MRTTPGSRASAASRSNSRARSSRSPLADGRLAPARVDPQRADLDRPAAASAAVGPAQDRLDPGDQRARVERLRDVVVGAELEADDRVDVVVPRGEHEDGRVAAPPDLPADLEAVDLRQHQVEDDEVGLVPAVELEARLAVAGGDDRPALLLEVEPEEVDDVPLVVDDQDRLHPARGYRPVRARGPCHVSGM